MSEELRSVLKLFGTEEIIEDLKSAGIEFQHLKYLNENDIANAVGSIGVRAQFREKLFAWRKDQLPASSKEQPKDDSFHSFRKTLNHILNKCRGGNELLEFYKSNNKLTDARRKKLIDIILEYSFENKINLTPIHFKDIINEIKEIFPKEEKVLEYYYIPRQGKRPPGGKLYSKYCYIKNKKKRFDVSDIDDRQHSNAALDTNEFDEIIESSLKEELRRESTDWQTICDRWEKTFNLRRKDLSTLDNFSFMLEWPKLKDSRAPTLINNDFMRLFNGKSHLLKSKWSYFKQNIKKYYQRNISSPACKTLFLDALDTTNIDAEDCILTALLNSVLPPNGRFQAKKSKATILDAQDYFILRVVSINNINIKIQELIEKSYANRITIQPLMVVEGELSSPNSFYIYLDKTLYKFENFLDCLDCAFKTYQVLNLSYPTICANVWTFIQKYFFEIKTSTDIKTATIASLLNFFEN